MDMCLSEVTCPIFLSSEIWYVLNFLLWIKSVFFLFSVALALIHDFIISHLDSYKI